MISKMLAASCMAVTALAATLPVQAATDREKEQLALFQRFAGAPVDDMPFWNLLDYESLGDEAVAVWTGLNDAWLVTVHPPCPGLAWGRGIGLTSTLNRVSAKFDHVVIGHDRCKIASIQPVHYKALRAERKQKDQDR